jgi:hypothetical protein
VSSWWLAGNDRELSRTIKQASSSSTVQGGGKRRCVGLMGQGIMLVIRLQAEAVA